MNIRKILRAYKTKILGNRHEVVNGALAGISLRTVKGTLRPQADQDDAWLFHLMGHFDRIFDIGTNIGQSALFAKVQGKDKQLLLADPNPEALALAAKNLILNNMAHHCEFVTSFVSDRPGEEIEFFTVGVGAAGSMYRSHAHTASAIGSSFRMPTTTIDELAAMAGWEPDFVKIDVEGAEAKVLQGARGLASKQKTLFMVEMHSPPELPMVENARLVLQWAKEVNYQVWYMRDAVQLSDPEMIADRGRCHLLFLPRQEKYPEMVKGIPQGAPLLSNY